MPTKPKATGGVLSEPLPTVGENHGPVVPATTCTGADTCSAATGRWKRATDLGGNATTVTTDDGGMWNRACLATGCPVRTYI